MVDVDDDENRSGGGDFWHFSSGRMIAGYVAKSRINILTSYYDHSPNKPRIADVEHSFINEDHGQKRVVTRQSLISSSLWKRYRRDSSPIGHPQ